jgi:osmoprotectant transport system ATP-binding protein
LQRTNLHIAAQKTTVLIGPSGCGKSTLLRLIAGLVKMDQGEIRFNGTALNPTNINRLRHRMGYVIQEGGLFPHFTAKRNVTLMAQQLGWPNEKIDRRLQELLKLVQLPSQNLQHYPGAGHQRSWPCIFTVCCPSCATRMRV